MTQFIEPNKKSDLTAPRVLDWLQSLRTGLLSGFTVSVATGFNINIANGRVVIGGTSIHDDATRLNQSGLILAPGANNEHWLVYVSYAYVDSYPPAAMTIGAVRTIAAGVPPTKPAVPVLPANSVKIADIFVPGAALDLSTATVINAPPLPAAGSADGDVLIERLVASNANISIGGGGGFTYNGSTTLSWSAAINVSAPVITHREYFGTASLHRAQIVAGSLGPSPVVGPNSLLFAVVDRRTPNTAPATVAMRVLNLDAPDAGEMAAFNDPLARDKVIVLGLLNSGVLTMVNGMGLLPAPTTEPPARFLGMDPGGAHAWEAVDDTDLVGGLRVVPWTYVNPALMTAAAAAAAAVPGAARKAGERVRTRETATGYVEDLVYDGSAYVPFTSPGDGVNWGVVTGCAVTNVSGATIRVAPGQVRCHDGRVVTVYENQDVTVTTSQNVVWDRSDGAVKVLTKGAALFEDFVFAYASLSTGNLKYFTPCAPRVLKTVPRADTLYFGDNAVNGHGTHFDTLYHAMIWRAAHGDGAGSFKNFFMAKGASYTLDLVSLSGTVTATSGAGATVTGTGTRFLRDFAAGDWIKVGSRHAKVSVVASDTSMTVVTMAAAVVGATAYSRIAWIGPHAFHGNTGLSGIGDLTNVNIFSEMTQGDPGGGCFIKWGTALSGDAVNECWAPIDGGTNDGSHTWTISDLALLYDGEATDLTNHGNVAVDNVQRSWRLKNVYIDGKDTLSHALHMIDADVGVVVLDDVKIVDLSLSTAVYGPASTTGRLEMNGGYVGCPTAGKLSAVYEFAAGNTLAVLADDCTFDNVAEAVFIQNTAGDWYDFPRTLRRCRLGWDTVGARAIAIRSTGDLSDAARVVVNDCLFDNATGNTVTLTGVSKILASSSSSDGNPGTVVDNAASQHAANGLKDIVEDFATINGIGFKSSLGNIGLKRKHVQLLDGLTGQGPVQGYANRGIECYPAHIGGLKLIIVPNPGYERYVSFPDGRLASATGEFTNLITGGTDRATGAVAVDDTIYYAFLRKAVAGVTVDGVAYSSRAPQANGALNASDAVEGGRALTDYLFIGSVVTGVISSLEPWGSCRVVHYGNGLRRVWVSGNNAIHADMRASDLTCAGAPQSGTISLPSLNARLPTAHEFEMHRELTLNSGSLAGAFIALDGPVGNRQIIFSAQAALATPLYHYDSIIVPRSNGATVADYVSRWAGHGTLNTFAYVRIAVHSWLEDLNNPIPSEPAPHDGM